MSRQYGRIPRNGRKAPAAPQPAEIQINITGRHSMEQIALEMQRLVARLQDYGIEGVEAFTARLMPLDHDGKPIIAADVHGQPVTVINIPELPAEKPYRTNEPGLGVDTIKPSTARPDAAQRRPASSPSHSAPSLDRPMGAIPPRGKP